MSSTQQLILGEGAGGAPAAYQIERSLRFNSADSAYLSRTTWGTPTNRKKGTFSFWVKRSELGSSSGYLVYSYNGSASNSFGIYFVSDNTLEFQFGGSSAKNIRTSAVFRDPSAWYHLVFAWDTTDATAANRTKIYVNNVEQTLGTTNYPSQNDDAQFPATTDNYIGYTSSITFGGYLTEINFIDGSALTPSSFGETDTDTGVWKPKAYTGSYGTNGFYLKFADNSGTTSTTLGKDSSGNGNNWTPNNFSVTAGAGNDSLVDTPTPYGTDTGAGGEVRGNYATLNPLRVTSGVNLANGNLAFANTANADKSSFSTIALTSGKWYAEVKYSAIPVGNVMVGVVYDDGELGAVSYPANRANGYAYDNSGLKYNNGTSASYGATWTTTNTIGIALDLDAGTLVFYKDGVSQGTAYSSLPSGKTWFFVFGSYGNTSGGDVNFGQRPFAYTAPSGFKALCTQNLPTPDIGATATSRADDYFNTVLYTGNGGNLSVTGVGFQPDLVWVKDRTNAYSHALVDAVRGVSTPLRSNGTSAEYTEANKSVYQFNTDGFSVSEPVGFGSVNINTDAYVAWNWKANGAGSTNNAGSIQSTVSASTLSGFSIVAYNSGASGDKTVGHGLGVAPSMIITKSRSSASYNWSIYHASVATTVKKYLTFTTGALDDNGSNIWGSAFPTSSVFGISSGNGVVASTDCIAYCFAPIAGYSAFGSYTGNGSTDGPFIYTGFRPAYVLIKQSSAAGTEWLIQDAKRNPYNVADLYLYANSSSAEQTYSFLDMDSNGIKIRNTSSVANANGQTYIYAAFAEFPFKYTLAR